MSRTHRPRARTRKASGHALLEGVLILPAFALFLLGMLQLGMLQHGRILLAYAAYQAARAGSVWNGNPARMRDAAAWVLLGLRHNVSTLERLSAVVEDKWTRQARDPQDAPPKPDGGQVRVDILAPKREDFVRWGGQVDPTGELPFDERPPPGLSPPLLTVRVRSWYELRIPLAGAVFFKLWVTGRALRPTLPSAGLPDVSEEEAQALSALASKGAGRPARYLLPLAASHSLHLESPFHKRWVMHP